MLPPPPPADRALHVVLLGQEGPKPEGPVVLGHVHKPETLCLVVQEVAESHHLGLETRGRVSTAGAPQK